MYKVVLTIRSGDKISNWFLVFVFSLGLFLTFGCSGIVPAIHFMVAYGVTMAHRQASVGWMALMGLLYITGAIMYATRTPERFCPGKCDIWVSTCMSPSFALWLFIWVLHQHFWHCLPLASAKLWVVPLSLSPLSETQKNVWEKKAPFTQWFFPHAFFCVTLDGLSERGTTCCLGQYPFTHEFGEGKE